MDTSCVCRAMQCTDLRYVLRATALLLQATHFERRRSICYMCECDEIHVHKDRFYSTRQKQAEGKELRKLSTNHITSY